MRTPHDCNIEKVWWIPSSSSNQKRYEGAVSRNISGRLANLESIARGARSSTAIMISSASGFAI